MKILKLVLNNFRGIKELTIDFDGKDTDIYAANGVGKTTVANAICWLLVDRPATEEKDFTPQTAGMHEVEHSAEMVIAADSGEHITLKKVFYEKWTRKKGAAAKEYTGTVTDCYIDGQKTKAKDYVATVERICGVGLDRIRLLIITSYFADTMKNEDKRRVLFELCGEFSDEDIIAANKDLAALSSFLVMPGDSGKSYTVEQYKAIAAEKRKGLNKDLETLPIRIDELTKGLQETDDAGKLQEELAALSKEKADIEEERRQATKPDGQKDTINSAIAKLKTELETKRAEYIRQGAELNKTVNAAIDELMATQRKLNDDIYKAEKGKNQREEERIRLTKKRQELVNEYAAIKQEVWDTGAEICPTCGQKLPADKIDEHRREFNRRKSEKLAEINKRGQSCSQGVLQQLDAEIAEIASKIDKLKADYADGEKRLANLRETITTQTPFEETDEYTNIQGQIEELRAKRDEGNIGDTETTKIFADKIAAVNEKIAGINRRIAETQAADAQKARIEELQKQIKETAKLFEQVEKGIHLCEEFTRTKARLITDSINKHFSLVNFKLFKDQINGGLKEICEPMVKNDAGEWVEYKSVNFAGQINAKLDIANTLNKHYGTNLPLILDQAESVSEPMKVDEQLIRLIVSAKDTNFRIEHKVA